jgi:signal transduction histidine kinase
LKLQTKNTYYFLIFSSLAMIAGGMFLYFTVRKDIYRQIDTSLVTEKDIIRDQLDQTDTIPDFYEDFKHQIDVYFTDSHRSESEIIDDTIIHDDSTGYDLPYRYILYYGSTAKKRGYSISIMQAVTEKIHLLESISFYTIGLFLSLLVISLLINYLISNRLWQPFYKSVRQAERFNIHSDAPLELPHTNIQEFRQLNKVIEKMTRKMRNDYLSLKEFNENAAHELQTPLAVIRSKTELLMQSKEMRKESLNLIKSINEATNKLLKLNQGLLLISKIENQYYQEVTKVSFPGLVNNWLESYREIMQIKNINVETDYSSGAMVEMNEVLAEVLVSNLLSNAVRYNIDNGFIRCIINDTALTIENSGLPLKTNPEYLFRRFNKESDNPQSVGLGLSIVKKITESYKMEITYNYLNEIHSVTVKYRN